MKTISSDINMREHLRMYNYNIFFSTIILWWIKMSIIYHEYCQKRRKIISIGERQMEWDVGDLGL